MGHRNGFTPSHVFEIGNDQNWNNVHQERSYMHLVENVSVNGINYGAYWNPVPRSNGFSSSNQINEMPHYQPPGRSLESYLPLHSTGCSNLAPNNYAHNASSSSHIPHTFRGVEGGFSNRGPYKRKHPGISSIYEGDRYSDLWQENNPHIDSQHIRWDDHAFGSSFRGNGNGISIGGEGSVRNVRRRSTMLDFGTNSYRNPPHHSFLTSSYISYHSTPVVEHFGQGFNNIQIGPAQQGRIMFSDVNISCQENNHFTLSGMSHHNNASADSMGYHNDFPLNRLLIPQNLHSQPISGARSNYDQILAPAFRASSSNLHLTYSSAGDEVLQQQVGLSHPSRQQYSRVFSSNGWRHNNERSERIRISSERYRSFNDGMGFHEQFAPDQGLMAADRSRIYGSRNLLDQHRNLRLDVDNMSYEELLALGERIGHVNTGLSNNMINKSLTERSYCSSDQWQEELKCVICLEEYKNMDKIGTLKACRHDFHVSCIKKWLSLKNVCPICKTTTLADHQKD